MWKMLEDIVMECDECGTPLGPPPTFVIPPPPRPPSMVDHLLSAPCLEKQMPTAAQQAWDHGMCEAIPVSIHHCNIL